MEKKRDAFKSRTGFVIACIGSAVGMGNIWRFPYMVSDWGGMTFLLPYVLFVILIASTGLIEEMALGRAAKVVRLKHLENVRKLEPVIRKQVRPLVCFLYLVHWL